ncbi:hypothetical protein LSH36_52g01014 [Paralvinella palmiformis]|uniref:Agrin n=1 Tax=Paralvinella palmiformis TaxID=53620 RepID=A0AAD9K5Y1_9ANNE|nr:hypothetical protein LSH36_52g01014 [Paralvinella palmiformis]
MDKPVCGTDGVTYANECQLKVASCQKQQFIMVASEGHCDRCQNVKCKFGSRCENGRCVCPSACSLEYDPVCASNHKTYDNECRMMMDACNQQIELSVEYSGECEEFSGSGESSDEDVECNETNCRFGGICEFEISGSTKCNCDFNCDAIRDTVCGSDGNTYGSVCLLREQSCKLQKDIHVVDMDYCGEIIEEPCDGAPVEINPLTGEEFVCSKNGDQSCPANSYCHIIEGEQHGRCCKQDEQPIRSCRETEFGCCPDHRTAALGPKFAGCPSLCQCNPLGSQGATCDPVTGQCSCKPGVGGLRCDRCEPGYYGLPLIAANGNSGCIACNCNLYGSIRDDCEQMHGTCVCKPGIKGTRCDRCPDGQPIGPDGCSGQLSTTPEPMALRELESGDQHSARTCRELVCRFGAVCKMISGRPRCTCNEDCSHVKNVYKVCASNGDTYSSECEMRRFGCRLQKHVHVVHKGECQRDSVITPRTPTRSHKTTRHVYSRLTSSDDMAATPSTPEYGWIGDICTEDTDCVARDSYCRNGLCACRDGLVPNGQKTVCEDYLYSMLNDGWGSTYTVPGFSGINSYLRLKRIQQAYRQITIEMTFKTLSNEGILLYSGKIMNGTGDFISLSVKDGFVEFRYDLGSGPAVLRSSHQVTLNKFHKLKVQRFMKEGILYLDDMYEASSVSPGKLNNLNLRTDTFLGWVPNAVKGIYDNIGTAMALSGCIESLSIQNGEEGHVYDLIAPESADVIEAEAISECGSSACASVPCLNGGSCMSADPEKFTCKCPSGFKGVKCEISLHNGEESEICRDQTYCLNGGTCYDVPSFGELRYCKCPPEFSGPRCVTASPEADITVDIPQFHGDSYLELPLSVNPSKSLAVEIWFLPLTENGVLFYIQQDHNKLSYSTGDFMSLNLVNGHLQLRYNLGSGSANITSPTRLLLNVWHSAKISRKEKMAEMIVDENENVSGISAGALTRLNVPNIIWIGGFPGEYNPLSGVIKGFSGAIQSVFIDGSEIMNLYKTAKKREHITNYNGPPCDANNNPCLNNGQCIPKLNDYTCICTEDYAGKQCELTKMLIDTERPLAFDGVTNQEYENRITHKDRSQRSNKFEIKFHTTAENGLLLLQHKTYTVEGDYLTLALREGHVEASYNLGKETPDKPLVIRDRRKGALSVDDEDPITGVSTDGATQLDTDGRIWIGGSYTPPRGLPKAYMHGFKGCIDLVLIEDEALDLVTDRRDNGPTQYCDLIPS